MGPGLRRDDAVLVLCSRDFRLVVTGAASARLGHEADRRA
jgi:hypothetical protein